jgi:hypothetical protein
MSMVECLSHWIAQLFALEWLAAHSLRTAYAGYVAGSLHRF